MSVYHSDCLGLYAVHKKGRKRYMAEKYDSLAHTKYHTRYHIIFTPKYRRKVIYNQIRKDISEYFKRLLRYKGVKIVEGHMMPDHVHLLVSIPPRYSVSEIYLFSEMNNGKKRRRQIRIKEQNRTIKYN